ncbi:MAG TPA: condensation domain-containing protein, partial [Vicinamibacteria bacterium]|nr:condensation domain-containing protein [Vicinamibacteria bacterium]
FMIPQYVVWLEQLPRNASGKLDKRALPSPAELAPAEAAYVAPQTATQTLLAALWEKALGLRRIGIHDDFFVLGGHSLLAAQVLSRLNREHGIVLPFRSIFEAPTISRFASLIDGRSREERERSVTRIPRRRDTGPAAVSLMQERILLLEELDSDRSLVHNVPSAFRLEGPLDAHALGRALNDVVARQESLRTTFRKDGNAYRQFVAASLDLALATQDLRGLQPSEREPAVKAFLDRETRRAFDLARGPLFRAFLLRLQDEEHILFTLRHNAIWDGWSFDIFRHELASFYEAHLVQRPASLPELTLGYSDFAAWHREWLAGPEIQDQLAFWRKRLAGNPAPVALPTDRPRPAVRSHAGADEWIQIPRAEADLLAELGRELGATTFMVLLAAFGVLLHRYSGQSDVLIASPVRNRPRPETEDLIGLFTNTLMLRNSVDSAESFAALVRRVRATTLDAFGHQELPFDLLAREAPPVRVVFSLQEARHRETSLGPLRLTLPHVLPPAAAVDLNFWLVEMQDGLTGALNYSTELFDAATMRGFLSHYRELLLAIREDPERPVGRLRLVSAQESRKLVTHATAVEPPKASLVGALAARATETPETIALRVGDGTRATYRELLAEVTGRAAWLKARGVSAGDRVALGLEDAQQRLASLLGLLWLGATPVPLDPGDPPARRLARLQAAGAAWLWGDSDGASSLPASRVLPPLAAGSPPPADRSAPA